jgi:alpha-tubulin suppressor-like RCC1 family protein
VGTVTVGTGPTDAAVADVGTDGDVELNFTFPRTTLAVGTTTEVNPDQSPSVSNSGTDGAAVFDFDLPRAPTFTVGTVTTVNPDVPASVTNVGTDGDIVLDVDIPQGETGDTGAGLPPTSALDEGKIIFVTDTGSTELRIPDTDDVVEATNLYYTDARVEAVIAASDTDDLAEGATNLYYTDARADNRIAAANISDRADERIAAANISDLADVDAPSPQRGDRLVYNGNDWVASKPGAVTHVTGNGYRGWAFVVDNKYVYTRGSVATETGRGVTGQVQQPHRLVFPGETGKVVKISLTYSGYVLFDTGNLWVWGFQGNGNFGIGNTTAQTVPVLSSSNVVKFFSTESGGRSVASQHAFILKSDDLWYAAGYNAYGQLGDTTTTQRSSWTLSSSLNTIHSTDPIDRIHVKGCLLGMSVAISENDNIYMAGYNAHGALGDGTTVNKSSFTDVTANWGGNEKETLTVQAGSGYDDTSSSTITMLRRVKSTDERLIYGAGTNSFGMLGDGTTTQKTNPVTATVGGSSSLGTDIVDYVMFGGGPASCYALDSSGTLHVWGYNAYGQLGDATTTQRNLPIVGTTDVERILIRKSYAATDSNDSTGFIKKTDGIVYGAGKNNVGQLGDGTISQKTVLNPVWVPGNVIAVYRQGDGAAGQSHVFLLDDGQIYATGYNGTRDIYDWTTTNTAVPLPIFYPTVPINV